MKFISGGCWFDKGTEAKLLEEWTTAGQSRWGLFVGFKEGKKDEEVCTFCEFDIYDDNGNLISKAEPDDDSE